MVIGSWVGTDIFPTLEPFIEWESSQSQKGKEKAVINDNNEDTDLE